MSSPNDKIAIPIETEPTSSVKISTPALQDNSMCYETCCFCCSNKNNCNHSCCSIFWCFIDFICGDCCSVI